MGIALLYCNSLIAYTNVSVAYKDPARIVSALFLVASSLLNFNRLRMPVPVVLIAILSFISVLLHGLVALNFLLIVLFVLSSSAFEKHLVIRAIAYTTVISIVLYGVLYMLGLIQWNYTFWDGRLRNTLGFYNENVAATFFSAMLVLPYTFRRRRILWMIALMPPYFIVYLLTDSRSTIVIGFIMLLACALFYILEKQGRRKTSAIITSLVLYGTLVISFLLPYVGTSSLDLILSYRLTVFRQAINALFGTPFAFWIGLPIEIDNCYITLLANYGILLFLLLFYCIQKAIVVYSKGGGWMELALILTMLVYSMVEGNLFRPEVMLTLAFWYFVLGCNGESGYSEISMDSIKS